MRSPVLAILLALAVPVSGCLAGVGGSAGRFALYVSDAPDAIGDFRHLNATVQKVTITAADGKLSSYRPVGERFDLTQLADGNVSRVMDTELAAGNYTKIEIELANVTGVLLDGRDVPVKAPGSKVFVASPFEVATGATTHVVFDIQVIEKGNGEYQLQPNAKATGPRSKAPEKVVD